MKHTRTIALEPWQQEIVDRHPRELLKGLIHSDGCRYVNRVRGANGKPYEYVNYGFTNVSTDIQQIFIDTCASIGAVARRSNARQVVVSQRASVAILEAFVGPKE